MADWGPEFWKKVALITATLVLPFGAFLLAAYVVGGYTRSRRRASDPYLAWLRGRDEARDGWRPRPAAVPR